LPSPRAGRFFIARFSLTEAFVTSTNQRTLGRVLIALAIVVVALQLLGMLHIIPKLAPGITLTYPAFLLAIAGGQLYRRGSAQRR
jgi:uncharacterized membrane protein YhhN